MMYDSSAVQFVCLNSYRRTHSKKQKEAEKKKKHAEKERENENDAEERQWREWGTR
jgi:hypothetical protein